MGVEFGYSKQLNFLKHVDERKIDNTSFKETRHGFIKNGGLSETSKIIRQKLIPQPSDAEIYILDNVYEWVSDRKHFDLLANPENKYKDVNNWDIPIYVSANENTALFLGTHVYKNNINQSVVFVAPEAIVNN